MKTFDFNDKKLYNNMPLSKGMKIAPMVVEDRAISISMGMDPENMETFTSSYHGGKPYLVTFIEVPEEEFENYMKVSFRNQVNFYFDACGEYSYKEKFSHCRLEDGLPCPTRNCCGSCKRRKYPDKPELPEDENPYLKDIREKNCFTSYEDLVEAGFEGAPIESEAEYNLVYKELLAAAAEMDTYYPRLLYYLCCQVYPLTHQFLSSI